MGYGVSTIRYYEENSKIYDHYLLFICPETVAIVQKTAKTKQGSLYCILRYNHKANSSLNAYTSINKNIIKTASLYRYLLKDISNFEKIRNKNSIISYPMTLISKYFRCKSIEFILQIPIVKDISYQKASVKFTGGSTQ
jgi:hypothetical protein